MAKNLDGQGKPADIKVSVLCSNYNSDKWIDGYLDAVDRQTLRNFQLVVVDAASTDGSRGKILRRVLRDDIKITIILDDKKIPIYEAWNDAIDASEGDYCINWNTDDRLYPESLEIMSSFLDEHKNIDLVYGHCAVTHDEDHSTQSGVYRWNEFSIPELLDHCFMGPFPMWRKSPVVDCGKFDPSYTIVGDYEMWLRLAANGYKMKMIDKILGSYYHNPKGMSTDSTHLERHDVEKYRAQDIYKRILK